MGGATEGPLHPDHPPLSDDQGCSMATSWLLVIFLIVKEETPWLVVTIGGHWTGGGVLAPFFCLMTGYMQYDHPPPDRRPILAHFALVRGRYLWVFGPVCTMTTTWSEAELCGRLTWCVHVGGIWGPISDSDPLLCWPQAELSARWT